MTLRKNHRDKAEQIICEFIIPGGKLGDGLALFFADCEDDETGEIIPASESYPFLITIRDMVLQSRGTFERNVWLIGFLCGCIALLMMEALGRWQVTAFGVGEWSSLD